jgi:hypothetical protein
MTPLSKDGVGGENRDSFRFWFGVAFDGAGVRTSESSGELLHSSKAEQSLFSWGMLGFEGAEGGYVVFAAVVGPGVELGGVF